MKRNLIYKSLRDEQSHIYIYIYGTGLIAKRIAMHFDDAYTIKGFIETKPSNKSFYGRDIYKPAVLLSDEAYDFVIIGSTYQKEICEYLDTLHVPSEKILCIWDEKNDVSSYDDRLAFLRCMSEDLKERKIIGSVAELGVYKGAFARFINEEFPESKLYLFDTFEGFDSRDVENDYSMGFAAEGIKKNNLSFDDIEYVLGRMPFRNNCIIKKGYFPESATDVDDEFVFVSLDVDMYKPIMEGLRFFYPRMKKGGVIVIHDYSSPRWPGVKQAVRDFSVEQDVSFITLTDLCGSAVFVKN